MSNHLGKSFLQDLLCSKNIDCIVCFFFPYALYESLGCMKADCQSSLLSPKYKAGSFPRSPRHRRQVGVRNPSRCSHSDNLRGHSPGYQYISMPFFLLSCDFLMFAPGPLHFASHLAISGVSDISNHALDLRTASLRSRCRGFWVCWAFLTPFSVVSKSAKMHSPLIYGGNYLKVLRRWQWGFVPKCIYPYSFRFLWTRFFLSIASRSEKGKRCNAVIRRALIRKRKTRGYLRWGIGH